MIAQRKLTGLLKRKEKKKRRVGEREKMGASYSPARPHGRIEKDKNLLLVVFPFIFLGMMTCIFTSL